MRIWSWMAGAVLLASTACAPAVAKWGGAAPRSYELPRLSVIRGDRVSSPVRRVAIAPESGALGRALAAELSAHGLKVVSPEEVVVVARQAGLRDYEATSGRGLVALNEREVQLLVASTGVFAADGSLERAGVFVTDTATHDLVAGISWQNGWGGAPGTLAARAARRSVAEAASDIAYELLRRL